MFAAVCWSYAALRTKPLAFRGAVVLSPPAKLLANSSHVHLATSVTYENGSRTRSCPRSHCVVENSTSLPFTPCGTTYTLSSTSAFRRLVNLLELSAVPFGLTLLLHAWK